MQEPMTFGVLISEDIIAEKDERYLVCVYRMNVAEAPLMTQVSSIKAVLGEAWEITTIDRAGELAFVTFQTRLLMPLPGHQG